MTVYLMKAMFNLGQDSEKIKMKNNNCFQYYLSHSLDYRHW